MMRNHYFSPHGWFPHSHVGSSWPLPFLSFVRRCSDFHAALFRRGRGRPLGSLSLLCALRLPLFHSPLLPSPILHGSSSAAAPPGLAWEFQSGRHCAWRPGISGGSFLVGDSRTSHPLRNSYLRTVTKPGRGFLPCLGKCVAVRYGIYVSHTVPSLNPDSAFFTPGDILYIAGCRSGTV